MHRGCICVYVYMLMYLFMTSFIHQRIDWSVLDIHMPMSFHCANSTSSPPLSNPSSPPLCPPLSFPRLPLPLRPGQYLIRARKRDGILSPLSTNLLTSSPDCPVSAPLLPFFAPLFTAWWSTYIFLPFSSCSMCRRRRCRHLIHLISYRAFAGDFWRVDVGL